MNESIVFFFFWYITKLELQLSCENVEGWVRQDLRFSGYLKQALLKYAIATVYAQDGQEVIPERKIKLITYFEVGLGYIYLIQLLRANTILSTVEILRKRTYYTCRSFAKDLLFPMLTGPCLRQTFSQLQCILLSFIISFFLAYKAQVCY